MQLSSRLFQSVPAVSHIYPRLSRQSIYQQAHYQSLIDRLSGALRNAAGLDQIFQLAAEGIVSSLQVSRCFVVLLRYQNPLHKVKPHRKPTAKAIVTAIAPFACDIPAKPESKLTVVSSSDSPYAEFSEGTWLNHSFTLSDCELCDLLLSGTNQAVVIPQLTSLDPDDRYHLWDGHTHHSPLFAEGRSPKPITLTPRQQALCSTSESVAPILDLDKMPALMMVPLEHQDSVLGYLVVQHHQPCPWQTEEFSFVRLVAAQISTAIIQTHTLQQVQSLVDELTSQLQRSLDVQAKLYNKTRQQIQQLQELNRLKDEFLSTMSHELRTPLTSMMLAIRMLREAELSPERRNKYLDVLEQQCVQETKLINDLLALQKLETGTTSLETQAVEACQFMRDFTQSQHELFTKRDLQADVQLPASPLTLHTDQDSLTRILTELLSNACKYAHLGTTVSISADVHPPKIGKRKRKSVPFSEPEMVYFSIRNIGKGISAEELPLIFDKFRRGKGVTDQAVPGTGLGLALVKGLVEHLNGTITVDSHPLSGDAASSAEAWDTCFTVAIPKLPQ